MGDKPRILAKLSWFHSGDFVGDSASGVRFVVPEEFVVVVEELIGRSLGRGGGRGLRHKKPSRRSQGKAPPATKARCKITCRAIADTFDSCGA